MRHFKQSARSGACHSVPKTTLIGVCQKIAVYRLCYIWIFNILNAVCSITGTAAAYGSRARCRRTDSSAPASPSRALMANKPSVAAKPSGASWKLEAYKRANSVMA